MKTGRLEAFSDVVLAIIITIMVLELKVPAHKPHLADLQPLFPVMLSYALSFIYIGIYWNNHHHMLHATHHVTGWIMWANLHLLSQWISGAIYVLVAAMWLIPDPRIELAIIKHEIAPKRE